MTQEHPSTLRIELVGKVTRADNGGSTVLALHGEIDLSSAHVLSEAIDRSIQGGSQVVVLDFSGVTFLNSTGLGVMVAATKRLRAEGRDLVARSFRGIPASVLELTGLDQFLTIES